MATPISVLLLDDHAVVRDGLKALLGTQRDIQVVASFGAASDALRYATETPLDVAILDIALPGLSGIEVARLMHDACPELHLLMLSMHASPEYVYQALCAGASGYVLKESAGAEVVAAVRAVHGGQQYLSGKIPAQVVSEYARERGGEHPLERLSRREMQILKLIVEGSTSGEVAGLLGLSPKSVDTYRSRMMRKLDIEDLATLVKFAIRHGVTSVE
jgi:DNA-binding NarL/FixJ family response regulator